MTGAATLVAQSEVTIFIQRGKKRTRKGRMEAKDSPECEMLRIDEVAKPWEEAEINAVELDAADRANFSVHSEPGQHRL